MARVSVEDCIDKLPNKFELVFLAAHRARSLASGPQIVVDRANDKDAVIALREIAAKAVTPGDVGEGRIHSMQHNAGGELHGRADTAARAPYSSRARRSVYRHGDRRAGG